MAVVMAPVRVTSRRICAASWRWPTMPNKIRRNRLVEIAASYRAASDSIGRRALAVICMLLPEATTAKKGRNRRATYAGVSAIGRRRAAGLALIAAALTRILPPI